MNTLNDLICAPSATSEGDARLSFKYTGMPRLSHSFFQPWNLHTSPFTFTLRTLNRDLHKLEGNGSSATGIFIPLFIIYKPFALPTSVNKPKKEAVPQRDIQFMINVQVFQTFKTIKPTRTNSSQIERILKPIFLKVQLYRTTYTFIQRGISL